MDDEQENDDEEESDDDNELEEKGGLLEVCLSEVVVDAEPSNAQQHELLPRRAATR